MKKHVALIAVCVCVQSVVIRSELSRALHRVSSVDFTRRTYQCCVAQFDRDVHLEKQMPRDTRLKFAT